MTGAASRPGKGLTWRIQPVQDVTRDMRQGHAPSPATGALAQTVLASGEGNGPFSTDEGYSCGEP